MGFTVEQNKKESQAARRFQANAELQEVRLLDCAASGSESNAQIEGALRLGVTTETAVLSVAEGKAGFSVRIKILGDAADGPEQPERHGFEVVCRFALAYE